METKTSQIFDAIPVEYRKKCENGGKIEQITYVSKNYFGDESKIEKKRTFIFQPTTQLQKNVKFFI